MPNKEKDMVSIRECSKQKISTSQMRLCLGKNISGAPIISGIERMPHLQFGATGSGKCMYQHNILGILYSLAPEQCKMLNRQMVELSVITVSRIWCSVVTDTKSNECIGWAVNEMERR